MRAGPALTNRASLRPADISMAGPEVSTLLPPWLLQPLSGWHGRRAQLFSLAEGLVQCWLGGPAGPSLKPGHPKAARLQKETS